MDREDRRYDRGETLRRILIEVRDRVRIMIRREIRKECDRQVQITVSYQMMIRRTIRPLN